MLELENLRKKIDKIDNDILILLKKRFDIVKKVWILKKENNLPILQKERWEDLMKQKLEIAKELKLDIDLVKKIWESIHKSALERERDT